MKIRTATVATVLVGLFSVGMVAAGKPAPSEPARANYPDALFKAYPDLQRFRDPAYFKMFAADGLKGVDPKALFERVMAAAQAGETYKGLYLARIFTTQQPNNAAGWANRAQLAAALGFNGEAAVSQANAETGGTRQVPGGALPGNLKVRPTSLADWAAAIALAGDDVTAREGRPVLLAVKDDLSGLDVSSAEDLQRGHTTPWAKPKPVQIEDVLPNLFAMPQATPMGHKSMKGGMFALGALAMAGAAYSSNIGATDAAANLGMLYGNAMSKAFEVPSDLKGGGFTAVTYPTGVSHSTEMKPKTSGKHEAVGTPAELLWGSGSSMSPTVAGAWKNGESGKTEAIRVDARTTKLEKKKYDVPALDYPRLQRLCSAPGRCTDRVTVLEVMLTSDDLLALAPALENQKPSLGSWASMYRTRQPLTVASAFDQFAGFDQNGIVYLTAQQPTQWLTVQAGK